MTVMDMRELARSPRGRLVWLHSCRLGRYEPQTTRARPHTIPFTRINTGMIASCPYCGTVKHTREEP